MTDDLLGAIPSLTLLEKRFDFIRNSTLKTNVTIYLRYIILLLSISEDENLDSLRYSVYKDTVIYTASIVESVLDYTIKEFVVNGKAKEDVFGFTWRHIELASVNHECNEFKDAKLSVVKKEKKIKWTSREIDFDDINRAAKVCGILDAELYKKADALRKKRNLIHLASLEKSSDDYFKKEDVQEALNYAHDILLKAEELLKEL